MIIRYLDPWGKVRGFEFSSRGVRVSGFWNVGGLGL